MALQYDKAVTSTDFAAALAANTQISETTSAAINSVLGLDSAESVVVANWNGVDPITTPVGQTPNAVLIDTEGNDVTLVIPPEVLANAGVYIIGGSGNVTADFNTIERVIISGSGNDLLTVNGDRNTTLEGAAGNDTLITSGGNDSISGGEGNDSISAGAGNDTIVSGIGNDTIDAGTGRDVVAFAGNKADYTVNLVDGQLVVTSAASTSTLSNAEFISFNNGESVAVASNAEEATVLRLYQGILGRDADQEGADYWVNVNNTDASSVVGIANAFLLSTELSANGSLTDDQFVQALYTNALGRSVDAEGSAYWLNDLANGQERANVAINIVGSAEAAVTVDNVILITGQI